MQRSAKQNCGCNCSTRFSFCGFCAFHGNSGAQLLMPAAALRLDDFLALLRGSLGGFNQFPEFRIFLKRLVLARLCGPRKQSMLQGLDQAAQAMTASAALVEPGLDSVSGVCMKLRPSYQEVRSFGTFNLQRTDGAIILKNDIGAN